MKNFDTSTPEACNSLLIKLGTRFNRIEAQQARLDAELEATMLCYSLVEAIFKRHKQKQPPSKEYQEQVSIKLEQNLCNAEHFKQ